MVSSFYSQGHLHSVSSPYSSQCWGLRNGSCGQCIKGFSLFLLPPCTFPLLQHVSFSWAIELQDKLALVWLLHQLQFLQEITFTCSSVGCCMDIRSVMVLSIGLQQNTSSGIWKSPLLCDFSVPSAVSHSFCSRRLCLCRVLPFPKHNFPEVLPSCLQSSAVFCSGSFGTDCAHQPLLTKATLELLAPPGQHLDSWIRCTQSSFL